jgi:hypothetical protein
MQIYQPQATFQAFGESHPLLLKKLLRWAGQAREFPEDTRYVRERTAEQFVERYVNDFLINPPATCEGGTALMGAWANHLREHERQQISRLFGGSFDFTTPDHWYLNPRDGYLVLSEQVLEIYGTSTSIAGVKTLNGYNAQILNCERMLIVDVDLKEDGTDKCVVALSEEMALAVLTAISRGTKYQWRVYRTAGGLRYIEVSRPCIPYSQQVQRLMLLLYADPLYALLCRKQETFRARLTPKPWRSDIVDRHRDYLAEYFDQSGDFINPNYPDNHDEAVCELITWIGAKTIASAEFKQLVEVHDSLTKATPKYRRKNIKYVLT